jgi:hypothetical protein
MQGESFMLLSKDKKEAKNPLGANLRIAKHYLAELHQHAIHGLTASEEKKKGQSSQPRFFQRSLQR